MKKLTELDLQTALDECAEIRFKSHGEWLAGMVKRLNAKLTSSQDITSFVGNVLKKRNSLIVPAITTVIKTGNAIEPIVPCKT